MVFALLLTTSLAAEPVTAVMVQARSGLSGEEFKKAVSLIEGRLAKSIPTLVRNDDLTRRLKAAGLDPAGCAGKTPCLLSFVARLEVTTLITISVSKVGNDRAWALAGLDVKSGNQLVREDWLDETGQDISAPVSKFADRLSVLLAPPSPPPLIPDTPVAAEPVLVPVVVATAEPAPTASKPLPKILLVAASVAAAAAIGCGIFSLTTSAEAGRFNLVGGMKLSVHTTEQAQVLLGTARTLTVSAIIAAVVAAGLGVGTVLTW